MAELGYFTAEEEAIKSRFREKYCYFSGEEIDDFYNLAVATYLDLAYPFHHDITDIPKARPRAVAWVRDCMDEIIQRNGITATSYSENGLSYEWDTSMVSDMLRQRVIGKGKVIS